MPRAAAAVGFGAHGTLGSRLVGCCDSRALSSDRSGARIEVGPSLSQPEPIPSASSVPRRAAAQGNTRKLYDWLDGSGLSWIDQTAEGARAGNFGCADHPPRR